MHAYNFIVAEAEAERPRDWARLQVHSKPLSQKSQNNTVTGRSGDVSREHRASHIAPLRPAQLPCMRSSRAWQGLPPPPTGL